jgi:two-component system cell cycle response regulator DivK
MPKLILVAEDQEDNAMIVLTVLKHFGYDTIRAADGVSALEAARTHQPDLMLLDVSMPLMDGWQVCEALKSDPATRSIQVVMFTAHAMATDEKKAVECGADDYISKPVEYRKIIDVVKHLIGEP